MNIENLITLKANVERTIDGAIHIISRVRELEKEVARLQEANRLLEDERDTMARQLNDAKNKARLEAGIIL